MDGIFQISAILYSDECADIIRHAESKGFQQARLVNAGRKNDETFLVDSAYLALLGDRLSERFQEIEVGGVLEIYRYGQGQEISAHIDDPKPLRSGRFSNMTLVVYLTDDFDGGGTGFPKRNVTLKPALGGALIFDQALVHCAEEVRRGRRVEVLSAAELRRREPALIDSVLGATYYPDDAQVDPARLTRAVSSIAISSRRTCFSWASLKNATAASLVSRCSTSGSLGCCKSRQSPRTAWPSEHRRSCHPSRRPVASTRSMVVPIFSRLRRQASGCAPGGESTKGRIRSSSWGL